SVTAQLTAEHRVIAAKNLECRDIDDGEAPRLEQPEHLVQCSLLLPVVERIEDVERGDKIECASRKGRSRHACSCQPRTAGLPTESQSRLRQVEPVCVTEPTEPFDVRTRTAAAVENADRRSVGGLADERFNKRS